MWGKIPSQWRELKILLGESRCWEPEEEWFWPFKPFQSEKQLSLNIGHHLKSKLVWPASKEYEIETKMVHEQWMQLKMKFLLGYNLKIIKLWWKDKKNGEFFQVGMDRGRSKFSLVGGGIPCQINQSMTPLPLRFCSFFNYL